MDSTETLLETSPDGTRQARKEWAPEGSSTINIKEEGDGNLGNADSEISGAKGFDASSWEDWN